MFRAKLTDLSVNLVPHLASLLQFFFRRAGEFRRIGERPMQARGYAGKDWTLLGLGLIANRDYIGKQLGGFENVEDRARLVLRNVDARFTKHFHGERIQFTRLEPGAFGFERIAAPSVEQGRGHLTARAVVAANEQYFLFHTKADSGGATCPLP